MTHKAASPHAHKKAHLTAVPAHPAELTNSIFHAYLNLIDSKQISQTVFTQLVNQNSKEFPFERALQGHGLTLQSIGESVAEYYGFEYLSLDLSKHTRPADLLGNIKQAFLEHANWLPVETISATEVAVVCTDLHLARASTPSPNVIYDKRIKWRITTATEYQAYFSWLFSDEVNSHQDLGSVDDLLVSLGDDDEIDEDKEDVSAAANNELVKLVNKIIIDAHRMGASDIHVEPYPGKGKTVIRVRKDGSLLNYIEVPHSVRGALITRIKIMCDLDISEKRKPQDGKIKFKKYGPLDIELRVATIPSQGGVEDVVMRILASGDPIPLDGMGFSARNLELIKTTISKPYGLFFVCGPTGSGKTTTLHSILKHINTPDTKIWTAEDPVEITQRGLRQVQVNKKAGMDFATIMRAFLRADPDVIMVGEMRDKETVSTGIEASLTGHLVFATLHTNSAPESIIRLLDMGMDPFNFADALLGILAQRLAKRLCSECKKPHVATQDELKALLREYGTELINTSKWKVDPNAAFMSLYASWMKTYGNEQRQIMLYEKVGCDKCSGTGYRGRVGLHELLIGSDSVKRAIQGHARVAELFMTAVEEGMRTLKQDGIEKVLNGITDMQQVRAVCIK